MFRLSTMQPCEIQGTIKVAKRTYQFGTITDIEGNQWDVNGYIGDTVLAVPLSGLHPYYSDTSGASYGLVQQSWKPYKLEIVK
jgi:hypothetical protein